MNRDGGGMTSDGALREAARKKLKRLIEDANAWRAVHRPGSERFREDDLELDGDVVDGGEDGQYWVKAVVYVHEKETR